ncbi:alpha/beta fold hydrolase, partial [Listeria monocytogenes]|nr:alpha/beta fold hydrolase [Listeria monocytogenes]EAE7854061.1 alpha/beta fold hydrolase [Listeria monocytogenes]
MSYMNVNGKKLYVEFEGSKNENPILFIHGAPGIGVLDFMAFQSKQLSCDYFVIAPEQRGTFRSESLGLKEEYSVEQIIEDYEDIRKQLGIKHWSIIAHSFGVRILLEYCNKYPDSIYKVIFESPVFNLMTPLKKILAIQLKVFQQNNYHNKQNYLDVLNVIENIKSFDDLNNNLKKL